MTEIGLEIGELVGESVLDVYAGTRIAEDARRAMSGEPVHSTIEADGRAFEVWYEPVEDRMDTDYQMIGVAVDITERAKRER